MTVVIATLLGVHRGLRTVKPLILIAVVERLGLVLPNAGGFAVSVTPVVVLVVCLAGRPDAVLVILLARLRLLFSPLVLLL